MSIATVLAYGSTIYGEVCILVFNKWILIDVNLLFDFNVGKDGRSGSPIEQSRLDDDAKKVAAGIRRSVTSNVNASI